MNRPRPILISAVLVAVATTTHAIDLSTQNKKELTVFGLRAMGINAGVIDVKEVLLRSEIEKLVQAGLNLQGRLCAKITNIRPLLKVETKGSYAVTCVTYRDGTAKESYYLEALEGVSYNSYDYQMHICKVC